MNVEGTIWEEGNEQEGDEKREDNRS
jgi:hypothetical protein